MRAAVSRAKWLAHQIRERARKSLSCHCPKTIPIVGSQDAVCGFAQAVCLLQDRVEDGGEVAGGGVDDPEHLGGGGMLFKRLAGLGDEARVLYRDDRLGREILQQRD